MLAALSHRLHPHKFCTFTLKSSFLTWQTLALIPDLLGVVGWVFFKIVPSFSLIVKCSLQDIKTINNDGSIKCKKKY